MKRKWISLLALLLVVGAGIGGIKIYQKAATEHQYGMIPKEAKKVDEYGRVQYTISVINEKGQTTFQTFTTIKQLKEGTVIDLFVRGNEVRKYDVITKNELPQRVKSVWPTKERKEEEK
ncbi:YxeA family protein [Priestia sp. JV24]|uniref:YxeA family protein n=1 Tax=Priestia TaxID=2800373 RepID=UPI0021D67926|nr:MULTISPECIES: YxeA family protein [Priestia]MCU7707744.1 YxeA family protein [Priestia megaterium]MCW1047369.1 YxeA family protein [Priestia sp. JV24]